MSKLQSNTVTLETQRLPFKRWLFGEHLSLGTLSACAMLLALGVVLKIFSFAIPLFGAYSLSLGLATIPVIFSGAFFGPLHGLAIGALADLLGYIVKPIGGYFPGFTISMAVMGLLPALFLYGRRHGTYWRVLLGIIPGQVIGSMLLNSWFLVMLGQPTAIIPFRVANQAVLIPIYALVLFELFKLEPALRRILRRQRVDLRG